MPLSPFDLVMVVVLPATVALLILLIGRRVWQSDRDIDARYGRWAGPLAMGVALLVAFPWKTVMNGVTIFPPRESVGWIFYAAKLAALAGIIDAIIRLPLIVRALLVFVLSALASAVMFKFKWIGDTPDWSRANAVMIFAGIGAVATVWWAVLDWIESDRHCFASTPWIFWMITAGASAICGMFGGLKQAQLIGALAAASGAALVLTLVRRRPIFVRGTAMVLSILVVPLLFGMFYLIDLKPGEAPLLIAVLCSIAAVAIGRAIPVAGRPAWLRTTIRVAPVAIFMLVVLILAGRQFKKAMQEDAESGEYSAAPSSCSTSVI